MADHHTRGGGYRGGHLLRLPRDGGAVVGGGGRRMGRSDTGVHRPEGHLRRPYYPRRTGAQELGPLPYAEAAVVAIDAATLGLVARLVPSGLLCAGPGHSFVCYLG